MKEKAGKKNRLEAQHTESLRSKDNTGTKGRRLVIATLNCRTLKTQEREEELEKALIGINYDVIGLCEIRRQGEAIIEKENGNLITYIGNTKGQRGTGFLINKRIKENVDTIKGINDRIAMLKIKIGKRTILIIQIHAPTAQSSDEEIEEFYNTLEDTINKNRRQLNIILGDFNAKIGKKEYPEEEVLGNYGTGKRNERGEKLIHFAESQKMKIANTFFKGNLNEKWTWISPDGKTKNIIDHIMIDKLECVIKTEVIKDLNFDSDHRMTRIELNVRKIRRFQFNKRTILRNLDVNKYKSELNKDIVKIYNYNCQKPQEKYDMIENSIRTAGEVANMRDKQSKVDKLSRETQKLLDERKEILPYRHLKNVKQKYATLDKKVKRAIRRDLREYNAKLIQSIIEDNKSVKRVRKEIFADKHYILGIRDKCGDKKFSRENINKAATDYFRDLYKSKENQEYRIHNDPQEEEIPKIIISEVRTAISSLKNNRTPGDDGITNELLKHSTPEMVKSITEVFNEILTSEEIPKQWTTNTIILLHKKGTRDDLNNFRPISLMSNFYKIFIKTIARRIERTLDEEQPPEQAGFRAGYSTIDHLQTMNQLIEKTNEYNRKMYIALIDYCKAFDTIEHNPTFAALKRQGIPYKYIRILTKIYMNSSTKVRTDIEGEVFATRRGVRQGDPISPKLFTSLLEEVFRGLKWSKKAGISINGRKLTNLRFADDIVIFATSHKQLQEMLQELHKESKKVGLLLNFNKTKIMTNHEELPILIENNQIEYVSEYIYLGQLISFDNRSDKEISRRITLTWKKFWSLAFILLNPKIELKQKKEIIDSCILPTLIYGCQTWSLTSAQKTKITRCQRKIERKILNLTLKDRIPNEIIRRKTKIQDAIQQAEIIKWRWGGHVVRQNEKRWGHTTTLWYPRSGWRRQGRQYKRWQDSFTDTAGPKRTRLAQDRMEWRARIK